MSGLAAELAPYVELALRSVHREYPNQISHRLASDAEVQPPRALHPAFYGCYDWHSAVHGHWLLARAARLCPAAGFRRDAEASLARSLTPAKLTIEGEYLAARPAYERPYGLAWLLQLHGELTEGASDASAEQAAALEPLATLARDHLAGWLPKLSHPVRSGVHSQTAFAMGLALDWARTVGDGAFEALLVDRARGLFGADHDYPLHLEPSGEDFLSPALGAADLMRRVLGPADFGEWLGRALPLIPTGEGPRPEGWWEPVAPGDPRDGRLAHLDGLSLSRAFMLDGIVSVLPKDDPRIGPLADCRDRHRAAGLAGASFRHYSGSHWLGTFATYLLTRRGVGASLAAG